MSNRYIKTLSDKTEIDIRKIISVSDVWDGSGENMNAYSRIGLYCFSINTQGNSIPMYFDTEEEAKKERMRLIEIWYSIAAEDAMNSGILHYETRGE